MKKNLDLTYLDQIRIDKKVSIAEVERIGISKSKYYRWRDGEAELTVDEFNRLRILLNLNFTETSLMMEKQIFIDEFWETFDPETFYMPSSLITAASTLMEEGFYPKLNTEDRIAILERMKDNVYIQDEFILMRYLIDFYIAYLQENEQETKIQLKLIYQELMRRDTWTEFEILILTANTGTQARKRFKNLEEHLERSFRLDHNNPGTVGLISSIRFSFYMDAATHFEVDEMLKITERINGARAGGVLSQLVLIKHFVQISNEFIFGGKHQRAKEEIAFFIKAHAYTSEGHFDWKFYFEEIWQADKKWRKKLKVDDHFNLLR